MDVAVSSEIEIEWLDLPSGLGKYRRDPDNPKKGKVKCPDCGKEREVTLQSDGSEKFRSMSGRDDVCAALNRSPLKGVYNHPSGAIFFLDREYRDPDDPNGKTTFICANFVKNKDCPLPEGRSYGYLFNKDRSKWNGLCFACLKKVNHRWRKKTENLCLNDGPDEGSSTWILYGEEDEQGRIPVRYRLCGHTISFPSESIKSRLSAHKTGKQPWPSCCKPCSDRPADVIERLVRGEASNGNGQRNGLTEKRKRGRQLGQKFIDPDQTLADIQAMVLKLKSEGHLFSEVTANLVASKLHIGSGITGGSTMMERVKKCDVKVSWPDLRAFIWDGGDPRELKFKSRFKFERLKFKSGI
jgi:hypothetical protein